MTPAARVAAAIEILDAILSGQPAERALLRWSRTSRFAGSGDRVAVRDLVFHALRRRDSLAGLGGGLSGRRLMIGALREDARDPATIFTGEGHAPAPLTAEEMQPGHGGGWDLPEWLLPLWRASLGPDAGALAQAMRQRAPVWLRVNEARADTRVAQEALAVEGIETRPSVSLPTALEVVTNERRVAQSRAYLDGLVELQDLSPQLACAAMPLATGMRVLDYCAGGGGKSLALASRQPGLSIVAHDIDGDRMRDLPARAVRARARIEISGQPAGRFDLVVADVPCSGSGTWRRTPDAKWRLTPADLKKTCDIQAQIIASADKYIIPGGYLAYMTCSVLDVENGDRIANFLRGHEQYDLLQQARWTPLDAGDGFFLALLKKRE